MTGRTALVNRLRAEASSLEKGSPRWLGAMYFAALWTSEIATIEEFLDGLRLYNSAQGFDKFLSYNFEQIGEVKFLNRRRAALAASMAALS
jgi:hypothetical protein